MSQGDFHALMILHYAGLSAFLLWHYGAFQ